MKPRDRANPDVFHLPVDQIRSGYYSDQYFNNTRDLILWDRRDVRVRMQVFQKNHAVLGGIDEAIAILKTCAGSYFNVNETPKGWHPGWDELTVEALHEADAIDPFEPVMTIEGPYRLFAHLETVYLGTLARRTLIGTNVRRVLRATNGKPVIYFPARHDHWAVQAGDGYTAHLAGVEGVSTDAQANWWGGKGMGTIPHSLIAAYDGDTVQAAVAFAQHFGDQTRVSVLVDFDNDCAATSVRVANAFRNLHLSLWAVRLDTSDTLVDQGLIREGLGQFKPTGVCPELVHLVRRRLDEFGFNDVKIIVSGGFTPEKITAFEEAKVPVDAYGVGSSLLRGSNDFTADIVEVNGRPCAKVGRKMIENPRLERVV